MAYRKRYSKGRKRSGSYKKRGRKTVRRIRIGYRL